MSLHRGVFSDIFAANRESKQRCKLSPPKRVAYSAILTALACVIMLIGTLAGFFDMASAMLASFCVIFAVMELTYFSAVGVFFATLILSMLIGLGETVVYFGMFFGLYPLLKSGFERIRSRLIEWILKLIIMLIDTFVFSSMLGIFINEDISERYPFIKIIFSSVLFIAFILYDVVLTKSITMYVRVLRHKLRVDKWFR